MNNGTVLPYGREGSWMTMHSFHYACAYKLLDDFRLAKSSILKKEASLASEAEGVPPEIRGAFIAHETSMLLEDAEQSYISSIIYTCMAIEAFLNFYGVRRLGESYFRRNLERLGITEKFALLMLACHGLIVEKSDSAFVGLRAMFDARNQLVHPKARELSYSLLDQQLKESTLERRITDHFERMEGVIERLCELDSHILRSFEFRRPVRAYNT